MSNPRLTEDTSDHQAVTSEEAQSPLAQQALAIPAEPLLGIRNSANGLITSATTRPLLAFPRVGIVGSRFSKPADQTFNPNLATAESNKITQFVTGRNSYADLPNISDSQLTAFAKKIGVSPEDLVDRYIPVTLPALTGGLEFTKERYLEIAQKLLDYIQIHRKDLKVEVRNFRLEQLEFTDEAIIQKEFEALRHPKSFMYDPAYAVGIPKQEITDKLNDNPDLIPVSLLSNLLATLLSSSLQSNSGQVLNRELAGLQTRSFNTITATNNTSTDKPGIILNAWHQSSDQKPDSTVATGVLYRI